MNRDLVLPIVLPFSTERKIKSILKDKQLTLPPNFNPEASLLPILNPTYHSNHTGTDAVPALKGELLKVHFYLCS